MSSRSRTVAPHTIDLGPGQDTLVKSSLAISDGYTSGTSITSIALTPVPLIAQRREQQHERSQKIKADCWSTER